ncbi:hypothetical protein [Alkalihalobacillus trypoxylicola]|uniref:Lipoprotein n=1 Tax=Alkalihalobacillus trypoxylicola TaxID=519424 RepID=A0A161PCZ2_9BACI|nr:hypothetical protein [Alkalihalobacillus trypoxylicola]KYG25535.1 hypothetical protein AZF04_13675 [Alkalihalobacillus trypoxylicola]
MKKMMFVLGIGIVLLAACQMDSETQIIEDSHHNEGALGFQGVPGDKDKHRQLKLSDHELSFYADKTAQYLSNSITRLEQQADFFNQNDVNISHTIEEFIEALADIREETVEIINLDRPKPFNRFHEGHLNFVVELDALDRVLSDMRYPIDDSQYDDARMHYENAIISHKMLEREWLQIAEDYGIF